jgi:hypothetical protein
MAALVADAFAARPILAAEIYAAAAYGVVLGWQ